MIERYMLNEELEEKIIKITGVDYTGMLTITDIENIIKDLITEYHCLEEKLEDKEKYCLENHEQKKVDWYDYYGTGKEDFI